MSRLYVVGEDALCCALGSRLAAVVLGWQLAQPAVNTNGVTKLRSSVSRYIGLTRLHPVLCIADTDNRCALHMIRDWLPPGVTDTFLLRFAVAESESWLLADSESIAAYFRIPESKVPRNPDSAQDAKLALLDLARRSKRRDLRDEVVSREDPNKPGTGYNVHLSDYVINHWRPREASLNSPSLARAIRRLDLLGSKANA